MLSSTRTRTGEMDTATSIIAGPAIRVFGETAVTANPFLVVGELHRLGFSSARPRLIDIFGRLVFGLGLRRIVAIGKYIMEADDALWDHGVNGHFGRYHGLGVGVRGCGCKWNQTYCAAPSVETIRERRMCGDRAQLHICVSE